MYEWAMESDWDGLRFFLALYRAESVAQAARQLGVSEITIRRRIGRLEENYGISLFERMDGKYQLTTSGGKLLETAQQVEHAMENAREELSGQVVKPFGHVKVGAPDGIGSLQIAPALADVQRALPDLTIELITLPRRADLSKREVDVAIIARRPENGSDHRIRALKPVRLGLYASRKYLDRSPPIRTEADLSQHSFVGYAEQADFRDPIEAILRSHKIEFKYSFLSLNIIAQAHAAANGAGIALLPSYAAAGHAELVPVLADEFFDSVPLWLMIHKEMASLPRIRAVVARLVDLLAPRSPSTPMAQI